MHSTRNRNGSQWVQEKRYNVKFMLPVRRSSLTQLRCKKRAYMPLLSAADVWSFTPWRARYHHQASFPISIYFTLCIQVSPRATTATPSLVCSACPGRTRGRQVREPASDRGFYVPQPVGGHRVLANGAAAVSSNSLPRTQHRRQRVPSIGLR